MINKLKFLNHIFNTLQPRLKQIEDSLLVNKILSAKMLINSFSYEEHKPLENYEFKVFSQWGDDGIIQYLINTLDIPNKTFIEFGVEDYLESNTRFLLINNNWSGFILDGSDQNMDKVRNYDIYWKNDLKTKSIFITRENINTLLEESGFAEELGILSIDIDGNDYWIWNEINFSPIVVIAEYNSVFGSENPWSVPYDPTFVRSKAHYSNLYYGSSLLSLCDLAQEKGYSFIGCNSAGNNSYFVRNDKLGKLKPLTCEEGYVKSNFKEGRTKTGDLSFLSDEMRLKEIIEMPFYNTRTKKIEINK